MAVPKYPDILTEAHWNKNKGLLAKAAGETGVGAQMKVVVAKFKEVKWEMFDVRTAMKGGATADEATLALQAAKGAYEKRVKPLIVEIDKLVKKADDAEKKFKAAKTVPKSSAEHAAKVSKAAELLSAQVKAVNGEFAAFEKVVASSTVEDAVGAAWFDRLARVTFYRNSDVVQWTKTLGLAVSADDGLIDSEVQDTLADAAKELEIFKASVAKLQAARDKRFERRAAIKNVAKLWQAASDSFLVMKPGIMGLHRAVAVRQNQLAGSKEKFLAWEKSVKTDLALHKKVERILFDAEPDINWLDEHIDQILRTV
jgi:hypothetical protein